MANDLQFYLSFNNGAEVLRLPVNPETIRQSISHGYEDVMTTQLGELTVIGTERLREYSFSSFFPRDYNPSYCEYSDIPEPYAAAALIEEWIANRRPVRLTISGTRINIPVTIRSFTYEERAGHVGDLFYDIALKEYRFTELKKVTEKAADGLQYASVSGQETRIGKATPTVSSYTVKAGDSLTKIAHAVYVDSDKWSDIYNANKETIGKNPNLIYAGQVLSIT